MEAKSIRKAAKTKGCPFNENQLRALLKQGLLPGFYSGVKFNVIMDELPALVEKLKTQTQAATQ